MARKPALDGPSLDGQPGDTIGPATPTSPAPPVTENPDQGTPSVDPGAGEFKGVGGRFRVIGGGLKVPVS
jgi:hypothetical protein